MLNIGQQQYDALMEAMHATFKRQLATQVQQEHPGYASAVGAAGVAALVDLAALRSERRGYTGEGNVLPWLKLMVRLGVAFDEDPLLPWAGKLPEVAAGEDAATRLDALMATAEAYLAKVAGEKDELRAAALGRFIQASPQDLVMKPAQSSDLLANSLAGLYPEKQQAAGYPALQAFMQGTIARCLKAGISVKEKIVLLLLFDFLLGWEASTSPVFVPALTNAGALSLVDIPLPELLQRMKALMQGLLTAPAQGR